MYVFLIVIGVPWAICCTFVNYLYVWHTRHRTMRPRRQRQHRTRRPQSFISPAFVPMDEDGTSLHHIDDMSTYCHWHMVTYLRSIQISCPFNFASYLFHRTPFRFLLRVPLWAPSTQQLREMHKFPCTHHSKRAPITRRRAFHAIRNKALWLCLLTVGAEAAQLHSAYLTRTTSTVSLPSAPQSSPHLPPAHCNHCTHLASALQHQLHISTLSSRAPVPFSTSPRQFHPTGHLRAAQRNRSVHALHGNVAEAYLPTGGAAFTALSTTTPPTAAHPTLFLLPPFLISVLVLIFISIVIGCYIRYWYVSKKHSTRTPLSSGEGDHLNWVPYQSEGHHAGHACSYEQVPPHTTTSASAPQPRSHVLRPVRVVVRVRACVLSRLWACARACACAFAGVCACACACAWSCVLVCVRVRLVVPFGLRLPVRVLVRARARLLAGAWACWGACACAFVCACACSGARVLARLRVWACLRVCSCALACALVRARMRAPGPFNHSCHARTYVLERPNSHASTSVLEPTQTPHSTLSHHPDPALTSVSAHTLHPPSTDPTHPVSYEAATSLCQAPAYAAAHTNSPPSPHLTQVVSYEADSNPTQSTCQAATYVSAHLSPPHPTYTDDFCSPAAQLELLPPPPPPPRQALANLRAYKGHRRGTLSSKYRALFGRLVCCAFFLPILLLCLCSLRSPSSAEISWAGLSSHSGAGAHRHPCAHPPIFYPTPINQLHPSSSSCRFNATVTNTTAATSPSGKVVIMSCAPNSHVSTSVLEPTQTPHSTLSHHQRVDLAHAIAADLFSDLALLAGPLPAIMLWTLNRLMRNRLAHALRGNG